jgi:hypothetical protein
VALGVSGGVLGCTPEGALGFPVPHGDPGVEYTPLGETPPCGMPGWMGQSFVCGAWPSRATANSLWGRALREADTPYGKQPQVGVEPPYVLG